MKRTIKLELEINDEYVKQWSKNYFEYHKNLYHGDEEKARKILEENPLEKAIGHEIEDYVVNSIEGVSYCTSTVISE